MMLIHEKYVFGLQIEMKFEVIDPANETKFNLKNCEDHTSQSPMYQHH